MKFVGNLPVAPKLQCGVRAGGIYKHASKRQQYCDILDHGPVVTELKWLLHLTAALSDHRLKRVQALRSQLDRGVQADQY